MVAHEYDANRKKYDDPDNYRFVDGDMGISYQNFSDFHEDPRHGGPDRFIKDIMHALDNNQLAPSFDTFKKEVLVDAQLFAILTARANGPENLKR